MMTLGLLIVVTIISAFVVYTLYREWLASGDLGPRIYMVTLPLMVAALWLMH